MKRWIFRLVVFLLLGAIVNVAVAWGCAAFVGPTSQQEAWGRSSQFLLPPANPSWAVTSWEMPGALQLWVEAVRVDPTTLANIDDREFLGPPGIPPAWSRADASPAEPLSNEEQMVIETARGWPYLSMFATYTFYYGPMGWTKRGVVWGIDLSADSDDPGEGLLWRALPLRPIWSSFAINTLFYAAILWLLTIGPSTARRLIRHKRGRCIKCGYDLRGAEHEVCPECGT